MKTLSQKGILLIALLAFSLCASAATEKVVRVISGGQVVNEYKASEIDYIEVGDYVATPTGMTAIVESNTITVTWSEVPDATYDIYRSADNIEFTLLASGLTENIYVDEAPLSGTNYYRVKAIVDGYESEFTSVVGAVLDENGDDETITVYFDNTSTRWETPYIYYWSTAEEAK